MAISIRPKSATHTVVPCESSVAVWLMVEATRLGWPAAIGLMTSETNEDLKRSGWNFSSPSMIQMAPSAHCSVRWFTWCSEATDRRAPASVPDEGDLVRRFGDPACVRPPGGQASDRFSLNIPTGSWRCSAGSVRTAGTLEGRARPRPPAEAIGYGTVSNGDVQPLAQIGPEHERRAAGIEQQRAIRALVGHRGLGARNEAGLVQVEQRRTVELDLFAEPSRTAPSARARYRPGQAAVPGFRRLALPGIGLPCGQVAGSPRICTNRAITSSDITCSQRPASSWTRCQGSPMTSTRRHSASRCLRKTVCATPWPCSVRVIVRPERST